MKLKKHAEVITRLHELIRKEAEAQHVTGVPGKDTGITSVKDHEHADKEQVGSPEKHKSEFHQDLSKDPCKPTGGAKTAEELANEVLELIKAKQASDKPMEAKVDAPVVEKKDEKMPEPKVEAKADEKMATAPEAKEAEAQHVSGIPGKDTKITSVKGHETVNKEQVGSPEKHKSEFHQELSHDASKPMHTVKKSEETDEELAAKVASFELGRQLAVELLKQALATPTAPEAKPTETEVMKEAGRKDFDVLVAQAAESLQKEHDAKEAELSEKQAEQAGAAAFDELVKNAALETLASENQELKNKLAAYESAEKVAADKKAESDKVAKEAELAEKVAAMVIKALKNEPAK